MHMADALLSPSVGAGMCGVSAGILGWSSARLRREGDDRKVPLMGVAGALVFALQMVNFAVPGTGSSAHLGGGLLLAILLGPHAAFLTVASILTVQALFFADGGILALGCNLFNLGFFPAFIGLPLYRAVAGRSPGRGRTTVAAVAAALVSLQLGALGVVTETVASGISGIPFRGFLLLMLPIHAAAGLVEGFVTAAIIGFLRSARPGMVEGSGSEEVGGGVVAGLLAAALVVAVFLSPIASRKPDGLEGALREMTGRTEPDTRSSAIHAGAAALREKTAILPDYALPVGDERGGIGTPLAGLAGGGAVLAAAVGAGHLLRRRRREHTR
jgi:cobalt/nickel transport system permease protein